VTGKPAKQLFQVWLLLLLTSVACNLPTAVEMEEVNTPVSSITITITAEPTITPTDKPTVTFTFTPLPSPTNTVTPTPSHTPTTTPTVSPTTTITPTYSILHGQVLEQANCRFGPGYPYLYKFGLFPETVLEIIGRNELGTWVLIRGIGGTNTCWVKASLLEIRGDVMSVAPAFTPLPQSPYYGPPTGVKALREGNEVTVIWYGIDISPGDDSEQFPYLIEAWVCLEGKLTFTPVGTYDTKVTILDEAGCDGPSHGRLYAVEKHGYTDWVEIPWPSP
jgi:hypothetical protein